MFPGDAAADNGAAIPPNLLAVPNTESNSWYLRYSGENGLAPHPARSQAALPEYFIRMVTDPGDLVLDPFAGSCVTGEVAERLGRKWVCVELEEEYLHGARGRFVHESQPCQASMGNKKSGDGYYRSPHPGLLWHEEDTKPLPSDGGRHRPQPVRREVASPPAEKSTSHRELDGLLEAARDKP